MGIHPGAPPHQCPDTQTLGRLLRDELLGTEAGPVEEHVGTCPDCQQALERLVGSLPDTVAEFTAPLGWTPKGPPPILPDYEALDRINTGGMGEVWRVRDLQFRRSLAIKVMKTWAAAAPRLVERFVAEAQICGQLAHPSIVPVHAMGRLADGRPYYTMKLVEGQTLAALLAGEAAPAERRLEFVQIFRQVCQALAFAHGQGVIHRDLKPDNVMVGAHGEVQLMDWGLAKVLADAGPGEGETAASGPACGQPTRTRAGSLLGTVAYMAPEQARGLLAEVDRQSDVFGLGAILYQVLTGEPPYADPDAATVLLRAVDADLGEALARLRACGADPELIRLAERCLAPDKADRPADASAVAAAVAAYVSGVEERLQQERLRREREQVQAAEERRRRKLWMGLAASVLAAGFLLAAGLLVVNNLRAQEQAAKEQEQAAKEQAQQREQETAAVMDELSSTLIDDWLTRQPELTAKQKEFLRKGLAYYENFTRQTGQTPAGRAALARAYRRVGVIRRQLGLLPEAAEALEQAVQLSEALAGEFPEDTAHLREAARALQPLALVVAERGDSRRAALLLVQAIGRLEAVQKEADDVEGRTNLATLHFTLGSLWTGLRHWEKAESAFGEAHTILKDLAAADPRDPDLQLNLAGVYRERGSLLEDQNKLEDADRSFREALPILKKLVKDHPSVAKYQLQLASTHVARGQTLRRLNRLGESRDAQVEALAVLKTLHAEFPSIPRYRKNLAVGFNNLALLLEQLKQPEEAAAAFREAIAVAEPLVKEHPGVPDYALTLGQAYGNLGDNHMSQGRLPDSLEWYTRAVSTLEPAQAQEGGLAQTRGALRYVYGGRAQVLDMLSRQEEAARDWGRAAALGDARRRLFLESRQALSLGEHARAVALAREQVRADGVSPSTVYDCACVCALAAAAVEEGSGLREQYAGRAVELLRQAVAGGRLRKSRQDVETDGALKCLRGREDFQQLLKQPVARTPARSPGP